MKHKRKTNRPEGFSKKALRKIRAKIKARAKENNEALAWFIPGHPQNTFGNEEA